jgi:hypothetical protein
MSGLVTHLATNRREFFKSSGRVILLGGLAAIAAIEARRPTDGVAPACDRPVVCQGCSLFPSCELPKAQTARSPQAGGPS